MERKYCIERIIDQQVPPEHRAYLTDRMLEDVVLDAVRDLGFGNPATITVHKAVHDEPAMLGNPRHYRFVVTTETKPAS